MAFLAESDGLKHWYMDRFVGGDESLKEWVYITPDAVDDVLAADYFDVRHTSRVMPGDLVRIYTVTDRDDLSTTTAVTVVSVKDMDAGEYNHLSARTGVEGGVAYHAGTFAEAQTLDIPAAVTTLATTGYAVAGDPGAAPYKRVVSEPLHEGKFQSADGAWWELNTDEPFIEMFGGKGDTTYTTFAGLPGVVTAGVDNRQPFIDMMEYARKRAQAAGAVAPLCPVNFSYGVYYFSDYVNVKLSIHVKAPAAAGMAGGHASEIVFPANKTGFIFHRWDTIDFEKMVAGPTASQADGSIWEGPALLATYGGTSGNGIQARCRVTFREPVIKGFGNAGIYIVATAGSGDVAVHGNANYWRGFGGRISLCRYGIFVDGADANGGTWIGGEVTDNKICGVYDSSFLGNDWIGIGTDGNGGRDPLYPVGAYNDGNRYACLLPEFADTTEPTVATSYPVVPLESNPTWIWRSAGAEAPSEGAVQWVSGAIQYHRGGGVVIGTDSENCNSSRQGGYDENNQVPGYVGPRCTAWGGSISMLGPGVIATSGIIGIQELRGETPFYFHDSASGTIKGGAVHNRGSKTTLDGGRGARYAIEVHYESDGVTPRGAGAISGRVVSSNIAANTAVALEYWDATALAYAKAIDYNANDRTALPDLDLTWNYGGATKRWLSGWFGNLHIFPAASVAPTVNGQATFQLPSNLEIDIVVQGSDGTDRTFRAPLSTASGQATVATDADFTLTPGASAPNTKHTGTLTADRAVTLSTTGATRDTVWRITRTGSGAFNLNIGTGPLKALVQNTWAEVRFDGSAYYLSAYGAL